ncbi:MAG: hypothetical protein PF692_12415 [Kiritimatiellae bacterium]|jgi:hypothetical protein|nr:hypothetical protein [Kiritimatiellia bacterium]
MSSMILFGLKGFVCNLKGPLDMLKKLYFILVFVILSSMVIIRAETVETNLLQNGDFSEYTSISINGWTNLQKAKVDLIDGKPTLIFNGAYSSVNQNVKLNTD